MKHCYDLTSSVIANVELIATMGEFTGKVVLITGASSGIGAETALHFAEAGASLSLIGRNEERLEKSAQNCLAKGLTKDKVLTVKADILNEEDVKRIIDSTIKHFGQLDVLVNNAGASSLVSFMSEDFMDHFDSSLKLNVRAVVQLTNLAVPHLIATKGCVVNVSSVLGKRVLANTLPYNVCKAAIDQCTRVAAVELAPKGVRVNAVNPGIIMSNAQGGNADFSKEQVEQVAQIMHPMGRAGTSSEVASVIKFLASSGASFVTGETLCIDGGMNNYCVR